MVLLQHALYCFDAKFNPLCVQTLRARRFEFVGQDVQAV
jgi:hypothetical protein